MTLYSTGMRCEELAHPNIGDIDSKRMMVRIRRGKGGKDRDVQPSIYIYPNAICMPVQIPWVLFPYRTSPMSGGPGKDLKAQSIRLK